MSLDFPGTTRFPLVGLLTLCCVAVVLLAACGDTRPTPTSVPPTAQAATPVPTVSPTPTPVPTATPTPMAISPDRAALEALYESTGGEKWTNSDNWRSDAPIGEWYGVTTHGGRVTELVLVENGLVGEIPAELGDLSKLERLVLRGSWLVGLIPSELSNLSSLTVLNLSENRLVGEIPPELGNLSNLRGFGPLGQQSCRADTTGVWQALGPHGVRTEGAPH